MPAFATERPKTSEISVHAPWTDRKLYLALFGAGLALRLALLFWKQTYFWLWDPSIPFSFGYEAGNIAAHLAGGLGFSSPFGQESGPTTWLAPVYPLLVAGFFKLFGVYTLASRIAILCMNCVFGAATAVTIHMLGTRTLGRRVGNIAAWVWALSPIFYRWAVTWVWEFALSAFLLTLVLLATLKVIELGSRRQWLFFAVLWGVVALTNPALLSLLPVTGLYAAFQLHRANRPWFRSAVLASLMFWMVVSPLMVRNYRTFHQFVFMRGNFWFEFYLGNYPSSNGLGYVGKHPSVNAYEFGRFKQLGEAGYIAWAKQQSFRFIREHPAEFEALTLKRTYYFWSGDMLPYQTTRYEWWEPWEYWPLSAMGLLGVILLFTRRPRYWFLLAAVPLVYPLPYYFTYPVAKYRHAIEPELLLASAFLVVTLWDEARNLRQRAKTAKQGLIV